MKETLSSKLKNHESIIIMHQYEKKYKKNKFDKII